MLTRPVVWRMFRSKKWIAVTEVELSYREKETLISTIKLSILRYFHLSSRTATLKRTPELIGSGFSTK